VLFRSIRRFDRSGKETNSYVPRSTIRDKVRLWQGYLAASDDRIGWYSYGRGVGGYIEVTWDGTVTTYGPPPELAGIPKQVVTGFALTKTGRAFVSTAIPRQPGVKQTWNTYTLERPTGTWLPVRFPADFLAAHSEWASLYGAEGDSLVLGTDGAGSVLKFFRVAP
jgi:hypothetical protein